MSALTSNSAPAKPQRPARWLRKESCADGRTDIVKQREPIEARLASFREAEKLAKGIRIFWAIEPIAASLTRDGSYTRFHAS